MVLTELELAKVVRTTKAAAKVLRCSASFDLLKFA